MYQKVLYCVPWKWKWLLIGTLFLSFKKAAIVKYIAAHFPNNLSSDIAKEKGFIYQPVGIQGSGSVGHG